MIARKNWIWMTFLLQLFFLSEAAWSLSPADNCITFFSNNDFDNAIRCFTSRIEDIKSGKDSSGRSLSGAYIERGRAWYRKNDFDRAIADYDRALSLDPKDSWTYMRRGIAWYQKKNFDRAIADFNRGLEINPGEDLYFNRGLAWLGKKDFDRALADYDQVIKLNPRDGQAYANRGLLVWNRKKDFDQALADYNRALEIRPGEALIYNMRGNLFFEQGRFIQASEDFKASLIKNPKDRYTTIWFFLALERAGKNGRQELNDRKENVKLTEWPEPVIQFYLGKSSSAEVLRLAKKQRTNLCEAYFFLGEHFLIKGDKKKAIKMFQLCLDTGNSDLREYNAAKGELALIGVGRRQ